MYCSSCGTKNEPDAKFCASCGTKIGNETVATAAAVAAPAASLEGALPASLVKRLVHYFLDYIIMYVAAVVIGGIVMLVDETIGGLFVILVLCGYHLFFEAVFQRTPAKFLTGTKVVMRDGTKPTFLPILGRTLARIIPFEPFSFLFYGAHPAKGWHDRLSHTLVVPAALTPEQVVAMNLEKPSEGTNHVGLVLIIIAGIIGALFVIGILASVVLASLNTAREKGQDASTKASLAGARNQAELYFDEKGSYRGLCNDLQITSLLATVEDKECYDTETAFAISAPLSTDDFYCVDSDGISRNTTSTLRGSVSCEGATADTTTSRGPLYDELKQLIEDEIGVLPQMIDDTTELTDVYVAAGDVLTYQYRLTDHAAYELEWSDMVPDMTEVLREQYCNGASLSYFRDKGVVLDWRYHDRYGSFLGAIQMSPQKCI